MIELKIFINNILINTQSDDLLPTSAEWNILQELTNMLKPFEIATRKLSAENYPTLSFVVPIMYSCYQAITLSTAATKFNDCKKLGEEITAALFTYLVSHITHDMLLACFFDPRSKKLKFLDEKTKSLVKNLAQTKIEEVKSTSTEIKEPAVMDEFELLLQTGEVPQNEEEEDTSEFSRYDKVPQISSKSDPLAFWKTNKTKYPAAAKLARRYLAIPATSVPSERVFSKAGNIVTKKRASLDPCLVEKLLFLHYNWNLVEKRLKKDL